MKQFITCAKNTHWCGKLVIKFGTIFSIICLLIAFFTKYETSVQLAATSVYMFSESIIFGLIMDVIDKRRGF